MRILLVDDEKGKREKVRDFLLAEFSTVSVVEARSFQSAMSALMTEVFDLVILDMRITSYDVSPADSGGRPRNLGGEEILEKMTREGIDTPSVVLTQFTLFVDGSRGVSHFQQLAQRMQSASDSLRGFVHFAHSTNQWEIELREIVRREICSDSSGS